MSGLDVPRVKCTARSKRTGTPCNNPPVAGATVCRMHGGSAPQVLAAARVRLQMAANRAAKTIETIMADTSVSASDRLKAAQMVLDRAGIPAKAELEIGVEMRPWEKLMMQAAELDVARASGAVQDEGGSDWFNGQEDRHLKAYADREAAHRGEIVPGEVVYDADDDPNGEA